MNLQLQNTIDSNLPNKEYFKSIFDLLSNSNYNLTNLFFLCLSFKNKGTSKEFFENQIKLWCNENKITDYTLKGRNITFEIEKGSIQLKHNRATMGFNVTLN